MYIADYSGETGMYPNLLGQWLDYLHLQWMTEMTLGLLHAEMSENHQFYIRHSQYWIIVKVMGDCLPMHGHSP